MPTIPEIQGYLQNKINVKITQTLIGKALKTGRSNISLRVKHNSELSEQEIKLIEDYFGILLPKNLNNDNKVEENKSIRFSEREYVEIKYWEGLPDEFKLPELTSKWEDKEIIQNSWCKNYKDLRVIPMLGNRMDGYWYPMRNSDILIIDLSATDLSESGVYFFTTFKGKHLFVRELELQIDGNIDIHWFENRKSGNVIYTKEELENYDFKVIGRIVKNVSFIL